MTFDEFALLPEGQKYCLLMNQGKCIAERNESQFTIHVYQFYSFYVEVRFSSDSNQDDAKPYELTSFI